MSPLARGGGGGGFLLLPSTKVRCVVHLELVAPHGYRVSHVHDWEASGARGIDALDFHQFIHPGGAYYCSVMRAYILMLSGLSHLPIFAIAWMRASVALHMRRLDASHTRAVPPWRLTFPRSLWPTVGFFSSSVSFVPAPQPSCCGCPLRILRSPWFVLNYSRELRLDKASRASARTPIQL